MVVNVKCKKCGQEFASKIIQTGEEIQMKNMILENNNEACPSCEQISSYSSPDYFWKI